MPPRTPQPSRERRLAAFLAEAGVAARRKAEDLVRAGKVAVNDAVVTDPAFKVIPGKDRVAVGGELVAPSPNKTYYLLNKPKGYLSAAGDPGGKPTVLDLVPAAGRRLYPVGRLDFNAEGLILLTDDGPLAHRLTHPRFQVPRVYLVKIQGQPEKEALRRLVSGITDEGERLRAKRVSLTRRTRSNAWCEVLLTEGRHREIRRLFNAIGHFVVRILRISYGPLRLGSLRPGQWRPLTAEEVAALKGSPD